MFLRYALQNATIKCSYGCLFFLLAFAHSVPTNTTLFFHYAQDKTKYYELDNTKT